MSNNCLKIKKKKIVHVQCFIELVRFRKFKALTQPCAPIMPFLWKAPATHKRQRIQSDFSRNEIFLERNYPEMRGLFFHYKTNNLLYLLRSNVMQGYNNNKRQEYKVTRVVHCAIVCKIVLTCSVVESVQFFYFNLFVFHSFFFFFCPFLYLLF